jgi:hypothetical protein
MDSWQQDGLRYKRVIVHANGESSFCLLDQPFDLNLKT